MKTTKIMELLKENNCPSATISNLSQGSIEVPLLLDKVMELLCDDSPYFGFISDKNKIALANLVNKYISSYCFELFMDNINLGDLLKYGKQIVYKVDASNGLRYATQNEVKNGIKGLIPQELYFIDMEDYKMISLIQWSISLNNHFYKEAGFSLKYNSDGTVADNMYDIIVQCSKMLNEIVNDNMLEYKVTKAIKNMQKMKKRKGFKYSTYEEDEIVESISIKQLLLNVDKNIERNSSNIDYRKALALVIKSKQMALNPSDISFLRKTLDKYIEENIGKNKDSVEHSDENSELKRECEYLLLNVNNNLIRNHFAFKIIDTIKKNNYKSCSPKQYSVISDALAKLDYKKKENDIEQTIKNEETQKLMNDAIGFSESMGNGEFENNVNNIVESLESLNESLLNELDD